jgi:Restriction endonuclease
VRRQTMHLPRGVQVSYGRRLRLSAGGLFWLALFGWFGFLRFKLWLHDHRSGVEKSLAIGLPLLLALILGVIGLILWLTGRRRAATQRKRDAAALLATAYTPNSDGSDFENQVAALLRRDGLEDVERRGGSGDLGADVVGWWRRGVQSVFVVIQCKNYDPDSYVGSKDVQAFAGTCYAVHEADVAAFCTTAAGFHPGAHKVAQANGIYLVAGPDYGRALAGDPLIPESLLRMAAEQLAREHDATQQTAPLAIAPAPEEATA